MPRPADAPYSAKPAAPRAAQPKRPQPGRRPALPAALAAGLAACASPPPPGLPPELPAQVRWQCGSTELSLLNRPTGAQLRVDGRTLAMRPAEAASGWRLLGVDDPDTEFWSRGSEARFRHRGIELPACQAQAPRPPTGVLRAQGQSPGWRLELREDRFRLEPSGGGPRIDGAIVQVESGPGLLRHTGRSSDGEPWEILLGEGPCADRPEGLPRPYTVVLRTPGHRLAGCGGDPLSLLQGAPWQLVALDGGSTAAEPPVSLSLEREGRLSGQAPCNRYSAAYRLADERLHIAPPLASRMACDPARMVAEQAFFERLGSVERHELLEDGRLQLLCRGGRSLTLQRP